MAFFIMHTLLPSLFGNQVRFSLTGIQARTCSPTSNASLRKAVGSPPEIQNPLCLSFIFCFLSFLFLFPTSNLFSLRKFTISLPPDPTTQLRIFMFQHQQWWIWPQLNPLSTIDPFVVFIWIYSPSLVSGLFSWKPSCFAEDYIYIFLRTLGRLKAYNERG